MSIRKGKLRSGETTINGQTILRSGEVVSPGQTVLRSGELIQ